METRAGLSSEKATTSPDVIHKSRELVSDGRSNPELMLIFRRTLLVLLLGGIVRTTDGQPCVVGSLQPIVATSGDNVVLPCHLEPSWNVEEAVVEWSRLDPSHVQYVHVYRDHGEVTDMKTASYHRRTALFTEELKHGNISLKIIEVTPADEGSYRCFIPTLRSPVKASTVQLIVKPNLGSATEFPRVPPTVDPESTTTDEGAAARGRAHLAAVVPFVLVPVIAGAALFWRFCRRNTGSTPLWWDPLGKSLDSHFHRKSLGLQLHG